MKTAAAPASKASSINFKKSLLETFAINERGQICMVARMLGHAIPPKVSFRGCGRSGRTRHSERSEESLFGRNPRKEGFIAQESCDGKPYLTPRTPFGMTGLEFFRSLFRLWEWGALWRDCGFSR